MHARSNPCRSRPATVAKTPQTGNAIGSESQGPDATRGARQFPQLAEPALPVADLFVQGDPELAPGMVRMEAYRRVTAIGDDEAIGEIAQMFGTSA